MRFLVVASSIALASAGAHAQSTPPAKRDAAVTLERVKVTASAVERAAVTPIQAATLPATASISAKHVENGLGMLLAQGASRGR